jgi:hypothetical protein
MIRAFALVSLLAISLAHAEDVKPIKDAGPYVPSPQSVVADMLRFASVTEKDFLIDLGSGDGRVVRTAATVFGARGFGVEIKDDLVNLANEEAKKEGIADRVKFLKQDLFKTNLSEATVITMYLLPDTVILLKDKFWTELKPGTRIVSHDYPLTGWLHEDTRTFDLEEKVNISGVTTTILWLYIIPAKVSGEWNAQMPPAIAKGPAVLSLRQQFTKVSGSLRADGKDIPLENVELRGENLTFKVAGRRGVFAGHIKGKVIEGTFDGKTPWRAMLGS